MVWSWYNQVEKLSHVPLEGFHCTVKFSSFPWFPMHLEYLSLHFWGFASKKIVSLSFGFVGWLVGSLLGIWSFLVWNYLHSWWNNLRFLCILCLVSRLDNLTVTYMSTTLSILLVFECPVLGFTIYTFWPILLLQSNSVNFLVWRVIGFCLTVDSLVFCWPSRPLPPISRFLG